MAKCAKEAVETKEKTGTTKDKDRTSRIHRDRDGQAESGKSKQRTQTWLA